MEEEKVTVTIFMEPMGLDGSFVKMVTVTFSVGVH